jgi:plastocyanin
MRTRTVVFFVLVLGFAAGACKKAGEPGAAGGGGGGGETRLDVQADPTQFKFQEASLEAPAGKAIIIEFTNPSQQPHTWVLVKPGDEEKVDQAAQASGGDAKGVAGVMKASGLVNAGGSETIDVGALEPGTYSYICTFPGHLVAGMKGTLTVK